jgi:hypothetical protein
LISEGDLVVALEFVTEGSTAVIPDALMKPTYGLQDFREETEEIEKKAARWTRGRGVQGLGIGDKEVDGKATEELALRVYVDRKKPKSRVKNPVPKSVDFPEIGEVFTDVIEIGRVGVETFSGRVRPAMPGCSIGHESEPSAGTFGCLVTKKAKGKGYYILSNSHVIAVDGRAEVGDRILQPGRPDGGRPGIDDIATLAFAANLNFSRSGYPNLVDAAIARVRANRHVNPRIRLIARTPTGVGRKIKRGMRVHKIGRTSDYTCGIVLDVHHKTRLPYRYGHQGRKRLAGFRDQVLCSRFTSAGDSGSLVLNPQHRVVGLHFAGSESASIFNKIENVLRILDVEIVK